MSPVGHEAVFPSQKVVRVATGQPIVSDSVGAVHLRESSFPLSSENTIGVIDFGASIPTPGVLYEWVVPLGQRARAEGMGQFTLIVSSTDEATRQMASYVAAANSLPLYVTNSCQDIHSAEPAGDLTATERETLQVLHRVGGTLTAADFGDRLGIEATAAGNRLVNLSRKGYVHRIVRSRSKGDLFVDPRTIHAPTAGQ